MDSALERLRLLRTGSSPVSEKVVDDRQVQPGHSARLATELLTRLPNLVQQADFRERFDERAGICEFDGCMTRDEAERIAYQELLAMITSARLCT